MKFEELLHPRKQIQPQKFFPIKYRLVWMFRSRTLNNIIKKVHERALRVILGDFESLLQNNKDVRSM